MHARHFRCCPQILAVSFESYRQRLPQLPVGTAETRREPTLPEPARSTMKKKFANWLGIFASIVASGVAVGQTQITNLSDQGSKVYPWHGNTTQTSPQTTSPTAPVVKGSGETVRFFQASNQEQQPSASDVPVAPTTPANQAEKQVPLAVQSNAIYENNCSNSYGFCNDWAPKSYFNNLPRGLKFGGFSQAGFYTDPTPGGFNFGPANRFNLHQNWFYLAKEARAGANWDYGFRADAVYGVDAPFLQAFGNPGPSGFDNGWDYGRYGWAMPQLYTEIANCNWRFKAGRFLSPIGYESIPSIDNFFYSRTFLRTYTEPYTMTGILGERTVNDRFSLLLGGSLGWDTAFDRNNGGFNLISGVRYRVNQNVRVGLTGSFGDTGIRNSGTLNSAYAEMRLTNRLCYVVQGDVLNLSGQDDLGLVNGLFYHISPKLAFGSRVEWWKSDLAATAPSRSSYNYTFGANYRPTRNVVVRPELRTDWGAIATNPGNMLFGLDAIFAF